MAETPYNLLFPHITAGSRTHRSDELLHLPRRHLCIQLRVFPVHLQICLTHTLVALLQCDTLLRTIQLCLCERLARYSQLCTQLLR